MKLLQEWLVCKESLNGMSRACLTGISEAKGLGKSVWKISKHVKKCLIREF